MNNLISEMKEICDIWVKIDGNIISYTQDEIHLIYDYITKLQERISYLERSNNRRDETIELERKENLELHNKIDKTIIKLNRFIDCCKCEKLESGSDYLHNQYWNMFENFNRQIKEILKDSDVDE